jgi:hypothetical protein
MLRDISVAQVETIARLAEIARTARDAALKIRPKDLAETFDDEPPPARGEHDVGANLGFDPLPGNHPARTALSDAIADLSDDERNALRAVSLIGRGAYAALDWGDALDAAAAETRDASYGALEDEVDLHNFLEKGLYELQHAKRPARGAKA